MAKAKLHTAFKDLAESAAPAAQIDLLPAINLRLLSAGKPGRSALPGAPRRFAWAAVGVTLVLLGVGLVALTPQGRSLAHSMLVFFGYRASDTQPLPSGQPSEPVPPTRTPAPIQVLGLQTVPAAQPTQPAPTPATTASNGEWLYGVTLEAANQLMGDPVVVPASLPTGYSLESLNVSPSTGEVQQIFKYAPYQSGEIFVLSRQPAAQLEMVGASAAVEQLQIGGVLVEYVQGIWFAAPGAASEQWDSAAEVHTFRWQSGEYAYSLFFGLNETFSPAYLTESQMLALVEVLLGARAALPVALNLNNLESIAALEQAAGFDILAPALIPEGFVFERGVYEPENQRVILLYTPAANSRYTSGTRLVIFELPLAAAGTPAGVEGFPPEAVASVTVNGFPGTLVRGALVDGQYDPDFGLSLRWSTSSLFINMRFTSSQGLPVEISPEDFLQIGISLE